MNATANLSPHPVRLEGHLERPSRWLWLLKWLLLLPHYLVLAFLWIAFFVLSLAAFVVLLFGGAYPRGIFDFNLGVLRWTWRVGFYTYNALGTDRYPPFTLGPAPDYPATLEIDYPERLSRWLVLVKWWLLAIPHYLVVGFFAGSGSSGGLVTVLALIAAVSVLFTSSYPGGIFDFVVGMNRWGLRVVAYAALMTDRYPPFRLDLGGAEPETVPPDNLSPGPVAAASS